MCLGIPGQITAITNEASTLALADVSGVQREINVACVVENQPLSSLVGKWVLIHVGFAMSRIDETEARKTLDILTELGELEEELDSMRNHNGAYDSQH